MEQAMEGVMAAAFCAAMAVMIWRLVKKREAQATGTRAALAAAAVGFGIGAVNKILAGAQPWLYLLYLLGFMLAYAAAVLSIPERKHEQPCMQPSAEARC